MPRWLQWTYDLVSFFIEENKAYGVMKAGNAFTIEPMINAGSYHDVLWPDKWTAVTVSC